MRETVALPPSPRSDDVELDLEGRRSMFRVLARLTGRAEREDGGTMHRRQRAQLAAWLADAEPT